MNLSTTVDVLRGTALFKKLDPKRLRVVAMMGETLTYREGERLFEEGEEGETAFVILEGEVDVLIMVEGSYQHVTALKTGELFGEIAVLTDQPRTSAIEARNDVTVLQLDRTTILNLMREFPDIALALIGILAGRLQNTSSDLATIRRSMGV